MKRLMATTTGAARDLKQSARHYPREVQVASGPITLRLMGEQDIDAVLAFAQTLPPDDPHGRDSGFAAAGNHDISHIVLNQLEGIANGVRG